MSDSVRPHRRQHTRLPSPWDPPGNYIYFHNFKKRHPVPSAGKYSEWNSWVGMRLVQPLWKTVWQLLKKLNTHLRLSHPTPRYFPPPKNKSICPCNVPEFYGSLIWNSQTLETTPMFINRWMNKQTVTQPCDEILLSNKKEWIIVMYNDMDESSNIYELGLPWWSSG